MGTSNSDGSGNRYNLKRRRLLKFFGGLAGGAALSGIPFAREARAMMRKLRTPFQAVTAANGLREFVDRLPIPTTLSPDGTVNGAPLFNVEMRQFKKQLHRDLPATTLWGYDGMYPAPTFEVRRGHPVSVRWKNNLPTTHFLPIDPTIHGAEPPTPQVRTVVHLHGIKVMPDSDGYPEAWFTNGFAQTGPFFETKTYHYPNDQEATTLWYHDHALGITRLNAYAGLSGGLYLIRDKNEDSLNLPSGPHEIPLVIQDRFFNPDGSLLYPTQTPGAGGDPDTRVPPIWIPEFFGDTVLVNGKVWPFLEVEPRRYRFRMLNASNARVYHLTLVQSTDSGTRVGGPVPVFQQIGSDGGFLPAPVQRTDLLMAPAERFDVVIDFSRFAGKSFVLANDAKAPYPDGDDIIPPDVMLFKVNQRLHGRDDSAVPTRLNTVPLLDPAKAVMVRDLQLSELDSADPFENPIMAGITNVTNPADPAHPNIVDPADAAHWDDPVTESPKAGSIEIWRIINTTGDAHPIHVHLVQFQILDRQPFDPDQLPNLVFTGPAQPPENNEAPARKDTVITFPGTVTRIIARFDLPTGALVIPGAKFRYVLHCHIMEHEENEMMRPYDVIGTRR